MSLLSSLYHIWDISLLFHVFLLVLVYIVLQQLTQFSNAQCKPTYTAL